MLLSDLSPQEREEVINTRYNGDLERFWYDEWCEEFVKGTDVSRHLTFFNREGLTEEEANALYVTLVKLGEKTGNMWTPRDCGDIPELTKFANRIYIRSPAGKFFKRLVPKRFIHHHFFWCSDSRKGNKKLIIDPTGVPEDFNEYFKTRDPSTIKPYFGLLEYAPGMHRSVYMEMKDMDDWGTGSFPPGFHP